MLLLNMLWCILDRWFSQRRTLENDVTTLQHFVAGAHPSTSAVGLRM